MFYAEPWESVIASVKKISSQFATSRENETVISRIIVFQTENEHEYEKKSLYIKNQSKILLGNIGMSIRALFL